MVARAVAGLAEGHRVALDLPDDLPAVRVDAGLLDRVVANLVDNALRHTGRLVQVLGEADPRPVRLHVVDHGPGVSEAARGRCSSRSSGSATRRRGRASGSGWRSPGG